MAYLNIKIYDALIEAGASEEKARAAAESAIALDVLSEQIKGMGRGNLLFRWAIGIYIAVSAVTIARGYFLIVDLALRVP